MPKYRSIAPHRPRLRRQTNGAIKARWADKSCVARAPSKSITVGKGDEEGPDVPLQCLTAIGLQQLLLEWSCSSAGPLVVVVMLAAEP